MSTSRVRTTSSELTAATVPFPSILCGVDGSRAAREAVREAAILAAGGGELHLVAVTSVSGIGATRAATLSPQRGQEALDDAGRAAREVGAWASCALVSGRSATDPLLTAASTHDLLVLGSHGGSRASGIRLGSTATAALHRCEVPVLLARPCTSGEAFPTTILVASDGSDASTRAVEVVTRILRRHGGDAYLLHVRHGHEPHHALAEHATLLLEATGREPVVLSEPGPVHERIVGVADQLAVSLVVVGSHGRAGVRALRSVSERVGHLARCPVLVAGTTRG